MYDKSRKNSTLVTILTRQTMQVGIPLSTQKILVHNQLKLIDSVDHHPPPPPPNTHTPANLWRMKLGSLLVNERKREGGGGGILH